MYASPVVYSPTDYPCAINAAPICVAAYRTGFCSTYFAPLRSCHVTTAVSSPVLYLYLAFCRLSASFRNFAVLEAVSGAVLRLLSAETAFRNLSKSMPLARHPSNGYLFQPSRAKFFRTLYGGSQRKLCCIERIYGRVDGEPPVLALGRLVEAAESGVVEGLGFGGRSVH